MKSNIEIAHEEYYIKCNYNEAILYCFQLNINDKLGWRLPTYDEFYNLYFNDHPFDDEKFTSSWFIDDADNDDIDLFSFYYILPVRDIT